MTDINLTGEYSKVVIEIKSEVQAWLEKAKATITHTDNPFNPIELTVPCEPNEYYSAYQIKGQTIELAIIEYCQMRGLSSPFTKSDQHLDTKLKPFTCKRCNSVLAFVSNRVVKVGGLVANIDQGAVVIRCEQCNTTRNWKPCDTLL